MAAINDRVQTNNTADGAAVSSSWEKARTSAVRGSPAVRIHCEAQFFQYEWGPGIQELSRKGFYRVVGAPLGHREKEMPHFRQMMAAALLVLAADAVSAALDVPSLALAAKPGLAQGPLGRMSGSRLLLKGKASQPRAEKHVLEMERLRGGDGEISLIPSRAHMPRTRGCEVDAGGWVAKSC